MPVGRIDYLHMGPMTFTEFLLALDENKLLSVINTWEPGREISALAHQRLLELLRLYCNVGGMPEAVKRYADTRSLAAVSEVHTGIIQTYRDDFPKYIGSRSLARIQHVFNFAARNVGHKVKYSQFSSDDKSATIKADIELLCMARVLHKVMHSHSNGLPLQAEAEEKIYKLLFLDIGLMNAICGLDWQRSGAINETRLVNEGPNAEQFVGQHLLELLATSPNRELTYWLREGRSNNAELDYVIALNGRIVPIEVKAGASGSLRSLLQFMAEKQLRHAVRFDATPPSTQEVAATIRRGQGTHDLRITLCSLPLYLVERLPALVATWP
jgi:predicted AAA+ superfamily ATPase